MSTLRRRLLGLVALLAILGKVALWAAVIAALGAAGYFAWRNRDRLKALFRRIAGRAA